MSELRELLLTKPGCSSGCSEEYGTQDPIKPRYPCSARKSPCCIHPYPPRRTKRPKYPCGPRLSTPLELEFFKLVREGCVPTVQKFLCDNPCVDINARRYNGESALRIATKAGQEEMLAFLTSLMGLLPGKILFYAIDHKQICVVKMFCECLQLDKVCDVGGEEDPEYPSYVTPLMQAAIVGSYELVDYFLNVRSHQQIVIPHIITCNCKECKTTKTGDSIALPMRYLSVYSAVSQPAYFTHLTNDLIPLAFNLHMHIVALSKYYDALEPEFLKLAKRLEEFAVDLIAECQTFDEALLLLTTVPPQSKSFWEAIQDQSYPVLKMALDYHQKRFVSHPYTQLVLNKMWSGNLQPWQDSSISNALTIVKRILAIPYIYYVLLLSPQSEISKRYSLPVNKMISSISCYLLFLSLVFYMNIKEVPKVRTPISYTSVELYITIYVFACTCSTFRVALLTHPKRFLQRGWNLYDLSILFAFLLAVSFWISAQIRYYTMPEGFQDTERKYWGGLDPLLMADGFFVLGSILAYLKILFFFRTHGVLGPMQISMDAMITEFIKYSCFWMLILFSFTIALGKFYSYYRGMKTIDPVTKTMIKQEDTFVSFKTTFSALFWGIFGLTSYTGADIILEYDTAHPIENRHYFTEFIGYTAFGCYMILMGIIIMNMVIATMGSAFNSVISNVNTEYSVHRTQVYFHYFHQPAVPPPFNILPQYCSSGRTRYYFGDYELDEKLNYDEVVGKLLMRYFSKKANAKYMTDQPHFKI